MNPSFVLVLKSERCIDKQNRQLSFLVKRDTKIANLKVKVKVKANEKRQFLFTNNTDEKERVECWTLSLPYNYKLW